MCGARLFAHVKRPSCVGQGEHGSWIDKNDQNLRKMSEPISQPAKLDIEGEQAYREYSCKHHGLQDDYPAFSSGKPDTDMLGFSIFIWDRNKKCNKKKRDDHPPRKSGIGYQFLDS